MSDTDFGQHMDPVARELWGEPNKKLSTATEIRWGEGGARKVNVADGIWFDHSSGEGGGVLALVMRELPATKEEALAWLQEAGFLEDRQPENRQQPRQDGRSAPSPDDGPSDPAPPVEPQGVLTAVKGYDYTDADGNSIYQVIRYQFKLPDGSWEMTEQGTPKKTFRQRRQVNGAWVYNLEGISHTIYRHSKVEIAIAEERPIYLCYSPDTEVLTPQGWVFFPDLAPGVPVAQYDLSSETVSFSVPKAHQRFRYDGDMVNIKAAWCDLLVTPDHRQPRRNARSGGRGACAPTIGPASTVHYNHQLPAAGLKRGGETVALTTARLLIAWLADGVWEPRGDQVSWNLKKTRKHDRLRSAFIVLGIRWTEHRYPSTPDWINFRVFKKDIAEHFPVGPDKLVQVPPGRNVAQWTAVLDRARKTWTFTATDPAKRESELLRIVKDAGNRLYMARYIDRDNSRGLIWWTGKDDRPRQAVRPAEPAPISQGMKEAIESGVPF